MPPILFRKSFHLYCGNYRVPLVFTGVAFALLPFAGFGRFALQFPGSWCFLNFHAESRMEAAYAIVYASFVLLMIVIIAVSNAVVISTLLQMRKLRKSMLQVSSLLKLRPAAPSCIPKHSRRSPCITDKAAGSARRQKLAK